MSGRGAFAALAGGLGLVALVITATVVGAVALVALGLPPAGRAEDAPPATTAPVDATAPAETTAAPSPPARPSVLVVALAPSDLALQAGVVRGSEVLLARGFEVELVRALAARLHIPRVRFVDAAASPRLLTGGGGRWQVAVASIRPPRVAVPTVALSTPYLRTDQLVLLRRGTARPRSLAELRTRIVCAIRDTDGAAAARALAPAAPPVIASGPERLLQLVQTGACDAALVDPVRATRLVEGRRQVLGPFAARVRFGDGYVLAVRPGTPGLDVRAVNRVLIRLRDDGTTARLARFWLGLDPASLPLLR